MSRTPVQELLWELDQPPREDSVKDHGRGQARSVELTALLFADGKEVDRKSFSTSIRAGGPSVQKWYTRAAR